uniref:Ubiquitin-like protease family profile domain-containing protein n=1 Tax=Amphimedon queenslandica TaxID=400682 RepID=A0A1X7UCZ9_AMPQE
MRPPYLQANLDTSDNENLSYEAESNSIHDPYPVAIKRTSDRVTVGHVPRKVSAVCSLFFRQGTIVCFVTGNPRHSTDLPQGGLEVPCSVTFNGTEEDIEKVKKLWERAPRSQYSLPVATKIEPPPAKSTLSADEPLPKKPKLDTESDSVSSEPEEPSVEKWVTMNDVNKGRPLTLSVLDKAVLLNGGLMNDCYITFAQQLLLQQFPGTKGLQSTHYIDKMASWETKIDLGIQIIQIIHDRTSQWIVASNLRRTDNQVEIYDSVYISVNALTRTRVTNIFQPIQGKKPHLKMMKMHKQVGAQDCGCLAITIATAILIGSDTSARFNQKIIREHLLQCFADKSLK